MGILPAVSFKLGKMKTPIKYNPNEIGLDINQNMNIVNTYINKINSSTICSNSYVNVLI